MILASGYKPFSFLIPVAHSLKLLKGLKMTIKLVDKEDIIFIDNVGLFNIEFKNDSYSVTVAKGDYKSNFYNIEQVSVYDNGILIDHRTLEDLKG